MRNVKFLGIVLGAGLALFAGGANAADATLGTCTSMADQVKTALNSAQQSANYDQANKEKSYGRDFCANGMYKVGIDHYAQALKLLGVQPS